MPKRAVFERSRRELSLDVSVGVHILLVVEQSSLESRSRGGAKTPTLTVSPPTGSNSLTRRNCQRAHAPLHVNPVEQQIGATLRSDVS